MGFGRLGDQRLLGFDLDRAVKTAAGKESVTGPQRTEDGSVEAHDFAGSGLLKHPGEHAGIQACENAGPAGNGHRYSWKQTADAVRVEGDGIGNGLRQIRSGKLDGHVGGIEGICSQGWYWVGGQPKRRLVREKPLG